MFFHSVTGKWLLKERALLYHIQRGCGKVEANTLLWLLLPYSRNQGDFIRRWQWDYPDALLFLFSQRQLRARPVLPSSTSLTPKYTPAVSHYAECSTEISRASPDTCAADLTVPKGGKDLYKMKEK